jgi:hypothetical protein
MARFLQLAAAFTQERQMQMRSTLLLMGLLAALAACDRQANNPPASTGTATTTPPASSSSSSSGSGQTAAPTMAEKKHGANPVQGQVDPKQREQHRDFQQKGDARGPTSPETTPPGPKR